MCWTLFSIFDTILFHAFVLSQKVDEAGKRRIRNYIASMPVEELVQAERKRRAQRKHASGLLAQQGNAKKVKLGV